MAQLTNQSSSQSATHADTVPSSLLQGSVSRAVIHRALVVGMANNRIGSASTRRRSEVRGSNRKPWRQKGTGRARAGSLRSPLWRGGGIIFGPQPRNYSMQLPRKQRLAALRSVLILQHQRGAVQVIPSVDIDAPKSKVLVQQLRAAGHSSQQKCVLIVGAHDPASTLKQAAANVSWLTVLSYDRLILHSLYYASMLLFTKDGVQSLNNLLHSRSSTSVDKAAH